MTTPRALPTWLIAALLFAAACALRLPGYDHGLPHRNEPDTYVVEQAEGLEQRGLLDRYDAAWKYPLFVATLVAAVPSRAPELPPSGSERPLEQHVAAAARAHAHARFVVALFAALIAPATFLMARSFLSRRWSALAAMLAAASLVHLCFSLQARPHAPASVTTILALVACARFARVPNVASGVWLGLGCGLAVASLQSGALVAAPLAVALALAVRARGRAAFGPAALALALVAGAAAWAYLPGGRIQELRAREAMLPTAVDPAADEVPALRFSGHVVPLSVFNGAGFRAIGAALASYDPFVLAAGIAGFAVVVVRSRRKSRWSALEPSKRAAALVFAGYYAPALLVYGVFARTEARLVLAFVPLVALFAAGAVAALARRLGARWTPALVAASLTVVLAPALRLAWLRARPDTVQRATAWLTESGAAPGSEVLALNLLSLPLMQAPGYAHADSTWSRSRWESYQAALLEKEHSAAEPTAQRLGVPLRYPSSPDVRALWMDPDPVVTARAMLAKYAPEIVVLATSVPATFVVAGTRRALDALRATVQPPEFELVETFASSDVGALDADVGFQTTLGVVLRARAFGPRIEVWRRTSTATQR